MAGSICIEYGMRMSASVSLAEIIRNDALRWEALEVVRSLALPDCWIGAGFVRDAVWDHLHGLPIQPPAGDVDVIWFDGSRAHPDVDKAIEKRLRKKRPDLDWSVKNQARMHLRNGDLPYSSSANAMTAWPETATAVAVRRTNHDTLEVSAPLGLEDLFKPRLVPTAPFAVRKRDIFDGRVREKEWLTRYPMLRAPE